MAVVCARGGRARDRADSYLDDGPRAPHTRATGNVFLAPTGGSNQCSRWYQCAPLKPGNNPSLAIVIARPVRALDRFACFLWEIRWRDYLRNDPIELIRE